MSGFRGDKEAEGEQPVVCDAGSFPASLRARPVPKDVSDMTAEELLSVVLGAAQSAACTRLAGRYGNFRELAAAHPADLRETGLTRAGVERLSAIFEIARRFGEVEWIAGEPFKGSHDVYAHFRERLAAETVEYFYAILLDNKHRKIRDVVLSQGSLTASIVHPRDVFSRVIRESAAALVLVHNHPSGDPTPSAEDL